jgi:hypothetical protein
MESITGEGLASADRRLESVSEGSCLGGRQLDHKSATTLQGNAHDDATSFLGHLERTIARPWLHGGHAVLLRSWESPASDHYRGLSARRAIWRVRLPW